MTALEIYEAQLARDIKHHAERVEWLSQPNPKFADGQPVSPADQANWKKASEFGLLNPSHIYNTGPQEGEE